MLKSIYERSEKNVSFKVDGNRDRTRLVNEMTSLACNKQRSGRYLSQINKIYLRRYSRFY